MFRVHIVIPFRQFAAEFVIIVFDKPGIDMLSAEWTGISLIFDIEIALFADNVLVTANLDRLPHKIIEAICAYEAIMISSRHF